MLELAAGIAAGDDVIGFVGDGRGDAAAGPFDEGLGFAALQVGQGAGEDENLAGQGLRGVGGTAAAGS